jgi:glycerol-3-phosphate cytidylyltransferase-like family protein
MKKKYLLRIVEVVTEKLTTKREKKVDVTPKEARHKSANSCRRRSTIFINITTQTMLKNIMLYVDFHLNINTGHLSFDSRFLGKNGYKIKEIR